jgi:hypothetical protein
MGGEGNGRDDGRDGEDGRKGRNLENLATFAKSVNGRKNQATCAKSPNRRLLQSRLIGEEEERIGMLGALECWESGS